MKKATWVGLAAAMALGSGMLMAAERTEQEQAILVQVRDVFAKQMGRQPTPEEEQRMLDQYRNSVMNASAVAARFQNLASGGAAALVPSTTAPNAVPAAVTPAALTEDALARKIADLGAGKPGTKIESARDGLKLDGMPYLDPQGQIKSFAFDSISGDITYAIRAGDTWIYKFMKAGSDADPVTIATGHMSPSSGWQINTLTGKQLAGDTVVPISRGLMIGRAGATFRYEPGKGSKGAAMPDGWVMAQFQRGNVGGTRFILIERIDDSASGGGLGSLLSAVQKIGATVGLSKKEDYALLNLDTGKQYPLNVQVDGKLRTVMSNCRKRNAVVNECSSSTSFESLYSEIGRNWGHYYWKINWYNTPSGPVAVSMENGVTDAYLLDLQTGKKVQAFHRGLGLTTLDSVQSPDGKLTLMADWMFETHKIDDALAYLRDNPDVNVAQTEKP